jgi:hypothetical protein
LLLASGVLAPAAANEKPLPAVAVDSAGHLSYNATPEGDRIPDFPAAVTLAVTAQSRMRPCWSWLTPFRGQHRPHQRALDYVAQSQPGSNGVRGAVLLRQGRHEVYGRLRLGASGVVLRGQGMETVLVASGLDRATLISVAGFYDRTNQAGKTLVIRDRYVPVGASSFEVDDASGLNPGDTVNVVRPSTQSWIDRLGMTEFGGGQGDWRLTWKPGSRDLSWDRVVRSVAGRVITVDAPVTTALEKELTAVLFKLTDGRAGLKMWASRICVSKARSTRQTRRTKIIVGARLPWKTRKIAGCGRSRPSILRVRWWRFTNPANV